MTAVVAAALLMLAVPAARAQAGVLDAACVNEGTMSFDPGLKLTPGPTRLSGTGSLPVCVSSQVVRGTMTVGTASGNLSCIGGTASGTMVFDWVTTSGRGASSTIAFQTTALGLNSGVALGLDGIVTEGLFAGDVYRSTFESVSNPLMCLSPGGVGTAFGVGLSTFERSG